MYCHKAAYVIRWIWCKSWLFIQKILKKENKNCHFKFMKKSLETTKRFHFVEHLMQTLHKNKTKIVCFFKRMTHSTKMNIKRMGKKIYF